MNATTKTQGVPVNPHMLVWAREYAGKSIDEVSLKFKKVHNWENSEASPTVKQARDLAKFYGRSFLEFFRQSPPELKQPKSIPDFRMHRGYDSNASFPLLQIQSWAEAQRENALGLLSEIGEQPKSIPEEFFKSTEDDPDIVSNKVRDLISFSFEEQTRIVYSKKDDLVNLLRFKLEQFGVLVLKNTGLKAANARGMCIAESPMPVIVFGNESPGAQLFTMLHELGHIVLKQSGVIGYISKTTENIIEKWCDEFAASFLMPKEVMPQVLGAKPDQPYSEIDDETLLRYAKFFRVSTHAMLIRLVHLKYVEKNYYWDVKKPEFEELENNYTSGGRPKYYGSRYKTSLGDYYTGLVLEAWGTGKITNHNAAEFMGIRNINHLFDIRNSFYE